MIGGVIVVGDDRVAADLLAAAARAPHEVEAAVRRNGQLLLTQIRANASGRPGPRAVTGNYRRSWTAVTVPAGAASSVTVGTNAPQARRLEYGFVGADSLGRVYNQPPYPHVAPAVDMIQGRFYTDLLAIAERIMR